MLLCQLLASLLSYDVVVSLQMHIAVDFDNALELANCDQLDYGGVDETKELAKGTCALMG